MNGEYYRELILPDIFFNTFRFKLLSLMIKISLSLAVRIKYKINFPLVFDDIFSGSDFLSKNSFIINGDAHFFTPK